MILDHLHSGLAIYFERNNMSVDQARTDGAVVLEVDGRHRIFCRPAPFGDLVLECAMAIVPDKPSEAEEMMKVALLASYVKLRTGADYPVLSRDGHRILIHQRIPSDATADEFEGCLENFLNSLVEWRRVFRIL